MDKFTFNFCPDSRVAETLAPEEMAIKDFNGWDYTPTPALPYRRKFKITLDGLRWYLDANGHIDFAKNINYNAAALEEFYVLHRKHRSFYFEHEWLGILELRFDSPLIVPKAIPNSNGLVQSLEFTAIHHNPRYREW